MKGEVGLEFGEYFRNKRLLAHYYFQSASDPVEAMTS
jgi:hypothetical protein